MFTFNRRGCASTRKRPRRWLVNNVYPLCVDTHASRPSAAPRPPGVPPGTGMGRLWHIEHNFAPRRNRPRCWSLDAGRVAPWVTECKRCDVLRPASQTPRVHALRTRPRGDSCPPVHFNATCVLRVSAVPLGVHGAGARDSWQEDAGGWVECGREPPGLKHLTWFVAYFAPVHIW